MTAAIALTQRIVALGLLAAVVAFVAVFPVGRLWLAVGFAAYALLLTRAPRAWLVVVPAAMPVLDLAFFSGWFFFDEFDALVLLTVAVLMWRRRDKSVRLWPGRYRCLCIPHALVAASRSMMWRW